MEKKYTHHISYIANNNITGCMIVCNNIKSFTTDAEIKKVTDFIQKEIKLSGLIITNILSFKKSA